MHRVSQLPLRCDRAHPRRTTSLSLQDLEKDS